MSNNVNSPSDNIGFDSSSPTKEELGRGLNDDLAEKNIKQ